MHTQGSFTLNSLGAQHRDGQSSELWVKACLTSGPHCPPFLSYWLGGEGVGRPGYPYCLCSPVGHCWTCSYLSHSHCSQAIVCHLLRHLL